jgi:hypothetical protein
MAADIGHFNSIAKRFRIRTHSRGNWIYGLWYVLLLVLDMMLLDNMNFRGK